MIEPLYKLRDVSKAHQVSVSTLRRLIKCGRLPATRVGNSVRLRDRDIARFVERGGRA